MSKLTAQELIYKQIIQDISEDNYRIIDFVAEYSDEESYETIWCDVREEFEEASEIEYETREGIETNLYPKTSSRHYEIDVHAMQVDGVWVAWDYYYGGGKFGEPESFDWIGSARIVDCEEKIVTKIEYVFKEI